MRETPESIIIDNYKMAHRMELMGKETEAEKIFKNVSDALVMNFLVKIEDEMIRWTQEQIEINKGKENDS